MWFRATEEAQSFETVADTPGAGRLGQLKVTAVPVPQAPPGCSLRLLREPCFGAGDRVLLVDERPAAFVAMLTAWWV